MLVNAANLDALRVGFSASFQSGVTTAQAASQWMRVAMDVPSTTASTKYGWLKELPGMREWLGPRAVQSLSQGDYEIVNKDYELTIGVDRNNIEDDNLGIYTPMFRQMGYSTEAQSDILVWALLKAGFATLCYDGQNFFDTDHPVLDADGVEQSVANTDGGGGTPWFLMDTRQVMRPVIRQMRKAAQFVAKDRLTDDNVFNNREFLYGVDSRMNVGFGFWQLAWGSKQTLNAANYATARAALVNMTGDYGRPLGLMPNLLVVPGSLESAGRKIVNSEYASGGETNEWKGTAELLVVPWLAG